MPLPELDDEARRQALEKAAEARKIRAELKQQLKAGEIDLAEVLRRADADEVVGKTKVSAVLEALPKVGKVRARKLMERLDISPSRRVRGLGANQREKLLEAFDRRRRQPRDAWGCRRPRPSAEGRLLVVSGPGGVGKGTVVAELARRRPDVAVSVSATTRDARPGEVDGEHYHFLSTTTTSTRSSPRAGCSSGRSSTAAATARRGLGARRALESGRPVVLEIEIQGARQVRARHPDAVLVFLAPPSQEALLERLRGTRLRRRGGDRPPHGDRRVGARPGRGVRPRRRQRRRRRGGGEIGRILDAMPAD
jgi:guanylate kinase